MLGYPEQTCTALTQVQPWTGFKIKAAKTVTLQKRSIYVFPEMKLRSLVPNFDSHVSVSDLYISSYFLH